MAGGIEYGFMSFTTDRTRDGGGRAPAQGGRGGDRAEAQGGRGGRAEAQEDRGSRAEAERGRGRRPRAEPGGRRDLHEHLDVKHNNDHHNDHRTTRRAFLRDDARPEVPQRGHHQVALVKATPSHSRPHTASDEGLQNMINIHSDCFIVFRLIIVRSADCRHSEPHTPGTHTRHTHEPSSETMRGAEVPQRGHHQVTLAKATLRSFSPSHRLRRGLKYMKLFFLLFHLIIVRLFYNIPRTLMSEVTPIGIDRGYV